MDFLDFADAVEPLKKYDWMKSGSYRFILVTPDNITECIDACINGVNGRFALDLETTGIDNRVDDSTGATKDKIVGVCLSGDGKTGWYIPLRHKIGSQHNIAWSLFDREFRRLMDAVDANRVITIFHNGKFDMEFLEFHGGKPYGLWDGVKRWEDTLILAYLRHSRSRRKGLKALSEAPTDADNSHVCGGPGLGMKMFDLEDLFPPDTPKSQYDYSLLDPSEEGPLIYGCSDAICTYKLYDLLAPAVLTPSHGFSQKQVYRIEKGCIIACRWMERNRIPTSPSKVMELIKLGQQEWFDSIMEVYRAASEIVGRDVMPGYMRVLKNNRPGSDQGGFVHDDPMNLLPEQVTRAKTFGPRYFPNPVGKAESRGKKWPLIYDVNAPKQLGQLFEEMGVPGLIYTEKSQLNHDRSKWQVKTAKDVLEMVIAKAEDRFPFMRLIKRFRETNNALSNYLFPMLEDVDPNDFTMRINFNGQKVNTGRFSTPAREYELSTRKRKRIPGWPEINLQSMPATYDPHRPACMTRLRECVVARKNHFIFAIDFASEELRLVTNLSREPLWLEEFFRCSTCTRTFPRGDGSRTPPRPPARCPNCGSDKIGDLHTLTALSIYGEDALRRPEWKQLRGNAKRVNFALCYGGGGNAVVRACAVNKNEGWRIKNQFDGTYTGLKQWWRGQHRFANEHGFVLTGFGRLYPVPDIWSADGGFRSKAERNSVNGPIQGCQVYEARVWTNKGAIQIGDLWERYQDTQGCFEVWTGKSWSPARTLLSGQKQKIITTFSSGNQAKTSPDHRFMVYRNDGLCWVRQEDLQLGDWVLHNAVPLSVPTPCYEYRVEPGAPTYNTKGFSFHGNNPALWEFLGLVCGDGSIGAGSFRIHVGGGDAQQQAQLYCDAINVLGVQAHVRGNKRGVGESHKLSMWQVVVHNKAFRDFCRAHLGVHDSNTYTKRFPTAIWEESNDNRAAFLRGYFSADGCVNVAEAVDVRSVNPDLLMDTHKLLRSLGIRSTVRLNSKRVSIKDRVAFRDLVGFLVPKKSKHLANIKHNPWTGQWHALPPTLITRIGDVVYGSSIYAGLRRSEKSAVLRLKAGSGSKPQCQRYLAKLPADEVPKSIMDLLQYDYEQVAGVEDTGEQVEMFDVEVFDDEHAFVCDGVIVHNSGADVIKIAMALVYKHCKKRGWLKTCRMIATMHDELVFEVHEDIIEQAIAEIVPIMTSNPFIMAKRWPVPLTTDCEIGHDWTVHWDLAEMENREVRFDGDNTVKEPREPMLKDFESPAEFQDAAAAYEIKQKEWEDMPHSFPVTLRQHFKGIKGGGSTNGGDEPAVETSPAPDPEAGNQGSVAHTESDPDTVDKATVVEKLTPVPVFDTPRNGVETGLYNFTLRAPLTTITCVRLAETITACRNKGTRRLRLTLPDGTVLKGWAEDEDAFYVNDQQFYWMAQQRGL